MNRKIFLILMIAALLLLYNIDKPFIGHHDWNGAFWGSIARNYLGNMSKLVGFTNWHTIDYVTSGKFIFFYHYTPLLPILFTISAFIFGLSEMSMRIVTVFFSLIMLFYIYKIGEFFYSKKTGILAAVLTMITPMFLYYGKLPDHEPILTSLCTATFYYYLTLNKTHHRNYGLFFLFLAFALLESWGGFFLLFFLILHAIFSKRIKPFLIVLMIVTGISVVFFHFLLTVIFHGASGVLDFFRYGIVRIGMDTVDTHAVRFSLYQYILTEARYTVIFYTRLLAGLSILWIGRFILSIRKHQASSDSLLIILFFYGFFFVLFFRNLAYIHDYKLYLLLPFIGLSSARMIEIILSKIGVVVEHTRIKHNWFFIRNLLIFLLVISVAWERSAFLKTLLLSSFDKPGYELGNYIRSKTSPKEKVLINSREFDSFYGVFIRYYANRKISVDDLTLDDFRTNTSKYQDYRYIILIDDRPTDKDLELFLERTYHVDKIGSYYFIDLQNPQKNVSFLVPLAGRSSNILFTKKIKCLPEFYF